jgi:hypothetical protein
MEEWNAVLTRFNYGNKQTLGKLELFRQGELKYSASSLELPWKNNQRNVSCIPEGAYTVEKRSAMDSPSRDYDHFIVKNVPDRSYILWHAGNYHWDIQGCILLGSKHKDINKDGLKDVINSKHTIAELNALLPDRFPFIVTKTIETSSSDLSAVDSSKAEASAKEGKSQIS